MAAPRRPLARDSPVGQPRRPDERRAHSAAWAGLSRLITFRYLLGCSARPGPVIGRPRSDGVAGSAAGAAQLVRHRQH